MNIGILLPKSKTHPLIGHDFFDGLKSVMHHREEIELFTANIGFGTNKDLLYQEGERLWLEKQVDLLIVFADFPVVETLFPLAESLNKLLVVVNVGAKFPNNWTAPRSVIFLTLNEWLNAFITGRLAAARSKKAIFASSFYDGGYAIGQSIVDGLLYEQGIIEHNFIGKHQITDFDIKPLLEFLDQNQDVTNILAVLSGELVESFLSQLDLEGYVEYILWTSQVFLYELMKINNCYKGDIRGYISWFPELDNDHNSKFQTTFKENTSREVSPFSLLGWESGLLLLALQDKIKEGAAFCISEIIERGLGTPRGHLKLDPETHQFMGDAYLVKFKDGKFEFSQDRVVSQEENLTMAKKAIPVLPQTGWLNTYLCS